MRCTWNLIQTFCSCDLGVIFCSHNHGVACFISTVPPDIDHAPSAYQVVEGSGLILFCNATGNPKPNITWTKQGNNSELSTSETLTLSKLTREDDGSVFECTAQNYITSVKAMAVLTVGVSIGSFFLSSAYSKMVNNFKNIPCMFSYTVYGGMMFCKVESSLKVLSLYPGV